MEFNIKITDANVYINGELCCYDNKMDEEDPKDDLNKKAILSLADKMGYEPIFLFEEIIDKLDEMLEEE